MLDKIGLCPACGYDWDGGDVYEVLRAMPSYADRTDEEVKKMAASFGWYDDLEAYRKDHTWITDDDAASLPQESRLHFSKLVAMTDIVTDKVFAYACPNCEARWDRSTGRRIH